MKYIKYKDKYLNLINKNFQEIKYNTILLNKKLINLLILYYTDIYQIIYISILDKIIKHDYYSYNINLVSLKDTSLELKMIRFIITYQIYYNQQFFNDLIKNRNITEYN